MNDKLPRLGEFSSTGHVPQGLLRVWHKRINLPCASAKKFEFSGQRFRHFPFHMFAAGRAEYDRYPMIESDFDKCPISNKQANCGIERSLEIVWWVRHGKASKEAETGRNRNRARRMGAVRENHRQDRAAEATHIEEENPGQVSRGF